MRERGIEQFRFGAGREVGANGRIDLHHHLGRDRTVSDCSRDAGLDRRLGEQPVDLPDHEVAKRSDRTDGIGDEPVGARVDAVGEAATVGHEAQRCAVPDGRVQQRECRSEALRFLRGDIDMCRDTVTTGEPPCQQRPAGSRRAGMVPCGHAGMAERCPVGEPSHGHRAGGGLHDDVGRGVAGLRSERAEGGDGHEDERRVGGDQLVEAQPQRRQWWFT